MNENKYNKGNYSLCSFLKHKYIKKIVQFENKLQIIWRCSHPFYSYSWPNHCLFHHKDNHYLADYIYEWNYTYVLFCILFLLLIIINYGLCMFLNGYYYMNIITYVFPLPLKNILILFSWLQIIVLWTL